MRLEEVTLYGYLDFALTCSRLDQCNLNLTITDTAWHSIAIICLPVTPALSIAPLELSHLKQVELLLLACLPPRMTWQTPCYVPASRPAQATTMKTMTWKAEEE